MGRQEGGKYVGRQVGRLVGRQVDRHARNYIASFGRLQKLVPINGAAMRTGYNLSLSILRFGSKNVCVESQTQK